MSTNRKKLGQPLLEQQSAGTWTQAQVVNSNSTSEASVCPGVGGLPDGDPNWTVIGGNLAFGKYCNL